MLVYCISERLSVLINLVIPDNDCTNLLHHPRTTITYGAEAQLGGSRDHYHSSVDRSENKTICGDNAQISKYECIYVHFFLFSFFRVKSDNLRE